jgi:hypothetical protein
MYIFVFAVWVWNIYLVRILYRSYYEQIEV